AEDGIRDGHVTGVQTCALPIYLHGLAPAREDDRLRAPVRLRCGLLARLVDRDVVAMRQRRLAVGHHQRVELDETMALLVVIADRSEERRVGKECRSGVAWSDEK